MSIIKQQATLIRTQRAANEAERLIQDWMAAHAGAHRDRAKKAISSQGKDPAYRQDNLSLESAATGPQNLVRRLSAYTAHYHPQGDDTCYKAHALLIFPHDQLGDGAVAFTIRQPEDWGDSSPPWQDQGQNQRQGQDQWQSQDQILARVAEHDTQQTGRGKRNQKHTGFRTLQAARAAHAPVILMTPRGARDPDISALAQEQFARASVTRIDESDQLNMSAEIHDDWLRNWLDAKAVLVKDSPDPVGKDHPLTAIDQAPILRTLLESLQVEHDTAQEAMAQGSIIEAFLETLTSNNTLKDLIEEAKRKDPESLERAVASTMNRYIEDAAGTETPEAETPGAETQGAETPAGDHQTPGSQPDQLQADQLQTAQARQRISTLEDQLQEQRQRNQALEEQLGEVQGQLRAYEEYMGNGKEPQDPPSQDPPQEDAAAPTNSRENMVMEAITQPGRFPHIRFLSTISKNLADYGKARPTGAEITTALDAVNKLADLYLTSENGEVGSWTEHFNLPGWTYANSESDTTMGKYPNSRRFRDQERDRSIVVQRHLTYHGSSSGLQIFFDSDGDGEPFIVAYIGEHLPYATSRS